VVIVNQRGTDFSLSSHILSKTATNKLRLEIVERSFCLLWSWDTGQGTRSPFSLCNSVSSASRVIFFPDYSLLTTHYSLSRTLHPTNPQTTNPIALSTP
jgi:hypothetical protein